MKVRTATAALVAKDMRVLAPVWLGTAAAMTVMAATSRWPGLGPIGAAIYALGSVALGAIAVGHEFRHGTMATLLAEPVRRSSVLATKLVVLAILLGALGVLAWTYGGSVSPRSRSLGAELLRSELWFVLPLLCGLGLAPWFTLLCRSELAGMVFAGAVPAVLLIGGDALALMNYGLVPNRMDESRALKWFVVEAGLLAAFAIGLGGAARAFQRLELVESEPLEAWVPVGRAAGDSTRRRLVSSRPRNAWIMLVAKELRLQVPAFGIAALFGVGWIAMSSAGEAASARIDLDSLRAGFAWFYVVAVAILIGANGSAEERQQGTLSAQLLVPMASWKQWSVKVVVVVSLTAVLAFGFPLLLTVVSPGPRPGLGQVPVILGLVIVLGLPLVGLYVSSLTTGSMRAFLASVGVLIVLWTAASTFYDSHMTRLLVAWLASLWMGLDSPETMMNLRGLLVTWVVPAIFVVSFVLLGYFAMNNHSRLDRSPVRLGRQLGWFAAMLVLLVLCESAAGGLFRAAIARRAQATTAASPAE